MNRGISFYIGNIQKCVCNFLMPSFCLWYLLKSVSSPLWFMIFAYIKMLALFPFIYLKIRMSAFADFKQQGIDLFCWNNIWNSSRNWKQKKFKITLKCVTSASFIDCKCDEVITITSMVLLYPIFYCFSFVFFFSFLFFAISW